MNIHPFADKFPMMPPEELDNLAADIKKNGLILPIITYRGEVIDGRNRLRGCELAGVEPHFHEWDGGTDQSPTGLILSLNVKRRMLTTSQKAAIAVEALPFFEAEAAERQKATLKQFASAQDTVRQQIDERSSQPRDYKQENANKAEAQAAKHAGTNREYVHMAKEMKEEDPERFERVRQGAESINQYREERLIEVRLGKRTKKAGRKAGKKSQHRAPPPSDGGQLKRQQLVNRTHEAAIRCAGKGRPLSDAEIAKEAGYNLTRLYGSHGSGLDYFLALCALIPWLEIRPSQSQDGSVLRQFVIDEELKGICEDRVARPAQGGISALQRVIALNGEIARRREVMQGRTRATRFNPESVAKVELVHVLDHIQEQLDLIIHPELAVEEVASLARF